MIAHKIVHMIVLGSMLLCACGSSTSSMDIPDNCEEHTAASLEGEWLITATGERYGCGGARDDGKIDITVKPFRVDVKLQPTETPELIENGDEADAFVDRVRDAEVMLSADLPSDVTFEGGGGTDCEFNFSITEQLSNGNELVYNFEGFVRELDQATGTLSGSGPGQCKIRGTFTLDRR